MRPHDLTGAIRFAPPLAHFPRPTLRYPLTLHLIHNPLLLHHVQVPSDCGRLPKLEGFQAVRAGTNEGSIFNFAGMVNCMREKFQVSSFA